MNMQDLVLDTISSTPKTNARGGIELISESDAGFVDWSYGKNKTKKKRSIRNLNNWISLDFVNYMRFKYEERYESYLKLENLRLEITSVDSLKDKLIDLMGFCDNVVLKDYIDYFFQHWADNSLEYFGTITINIMKTDHTVSDFVFKYNYRNRIQSPEDISEVLDEFENDSRSKITSDVLESTYEVSDTRLLMDYGLVISINWFIMCKEMSKMDAIKLVYQIAMKLKKRNKLNSVLDTTNNFSPYYLKMPFQEVDRLVRKIGNDSNMNVEFSDSSPPSFLTEKTAT